MERLTNRSSQRVIGAIIQEPNAVSNAINYAKFYSCPHDAVIRVYDEAGNATATYRTFSELLFLQLLSSSS
jgi:hypothetical protein